MADGIQLSDVVGFIVALVAAIVLSHIEIITVLY